MLLNRDMLLLVKMEKVKQWWKVRLSFRNATMAVCFFNLLTAVFLLHSFLSPASSTRKLPTHLSILAQVKYIKESEEMRRAMEPKELIKRVREIEEEAYAKPEANQQKDTKQTTAVDLISRLNDFRINSDTASMKALEEWRKRKMERAKQRGLGKNATITGQA